MTRVTIYPNSYLNNALKILDISDALVENLFTAPSSPGSYPMMKVEAYAGDILVEKEIINVNTVLEGDFK